MPIAKKDKVQSIKVFNTEIILGNTYELISRKDADAPQPVKGEGTVKAQFPGNGQVESVAFDENSRRWNTGFEVNSRCNRRIPEEEKKALVDVYVNYIQKPYENHYNTDTSATNDDFWGGNDKEDIVPYMIKLHAGKSYNTSNPKDLFDLFHALKQGLVCEVGEKDADLTRSALYCIENIDKSTSSAEQKLLDKAEAYATLTTLLNAFDPDKDDTIYTILEWINFKNIRGAEKEVVRKAVLTQFENEKTGADIISRFLQAYEDIKHPQKKQEMEMFAIVSKLNLRGVLEYKRGQYFMEGEFLGGSLIEAAKVALANPSKKEMILDAWDKIQK